MICLPTETLISPVSLYMEHRVASEAYILGFKEIQKNIFFSVANIFNLEVDLLFLDTITLYFEIVGENRLRKRSYSKDNHPELSQVLLSLLLSGPGYLLAAGYGLVIPLIKIII